MIKITVRGEKKELRYDARTLGGYVIIVDGRSVGRVERRGNGTWIARHRFGGIPYAGKNRTDATLNLLKEIPDA